MSRSLVNVVSPQSSMGAETESPSRLAALALGLTGTAVLHTGPSHLRTPSCSSQRARGSFIVFIPIYIFFAYSPCAYGHVIPVVESAIEVTGSGSSPQVAEHLCRFFTHGYRTLPDGPAPVFTGVLLYRMRTVSSSLCLVGPTENMRRGKNAIADKFVSLQINAVRRRLS